VTFERIVVTSEGMRKYKLSSPPMNPHPLQRFIDQVPPSSHVTAEFALAVAIDLIGMETAFTFVRTAPMVLASWVHLIETHGWGNNLRESDLQVNLLMNAIKTTSAITGLQGLKREEAVYGMIRQSSQGCAALEHALVTSLILNKGLELPWALVATLPSNVTNGETFGVWSGSHLGK
jgi:hypothetical protein